MRGTRARVGLPYLHHFDEPAIANRALEILRTGDLNPHFFHYGSLLIYMNAAVDVLHYFYLVSRREGTPGSLEDLDDLEVGTPGVFAWSISHPSFYLWNRWLTALFGTASVALVFVFGRHLGGRRAGLLAAATLAVLPFHVEKSSSISTDVPASFFALATVALALGFQRSQRLSLLLGSLVAGGLTVAVKYNLALCLLAPALALAEAAWRQRSGHRWWLWPALVVVPPLAFVVAMPYALFDLPTFLSDVGWEVRHYAVRGHGQYTVEPGWPHLFADLRQMADNTGWPAFLLAAAGLPFALGRRYGALLLAVPLLHLWLTAQTTVLFHRNLILVYPFLCATLGVGAVALIDGCAEALRANAFRAVRWLGDDSLLGLSLRQLRWTPPDTRRLASLAGIIFVAVFLLPKVLATLSDARRVGGRVETRSRVVDLLNQRLGGSEVKLAVAQELRIHRLDLERLEVSHEVRPLLEIACRPGDEDYIVVGAFHGAAGRKEPATILNELLATGDRVLGEIGAPSHLFLDRYSAYPKIQVRLPWRYRRQIPAPCAELSGIEGARSSPGGGAEGAAYRIPPGGWLRTPFYLAAAGRYAFSWSNASAEWGEERIRRLRAEIIGRDPEHGLRVLAQGAWRTGSRPGRQELHVTLAGPTAISLHLSHVAAGVIDDPGIVRIEGLKLLVLRDDRAAPPEDPATGDEGQAP